jgi:hypothetical protein
VLKRMALLLIPETMQCLRIVGPVSLYAHP